MIGSNIGHYEILQKLGEGGMGVVYKAKDLKLDRFAALKFLPAHLSSSDKDKDRLISEARTAASLNHPNICTIYGIDEHGGQLFLGMEFVEGETLRQMIERGSLSLQQIVDVGQQIASGLSHAHEKHIIHRDIKSENIMLASDGRVRIMDFGLAHTAGRTRMSTEGVMAGTVAYMPPEQIRGEGLDVRSDIWALGVTLYEAATGRMPFEGQYEQAIIYLILNESPHPPSEFRPDIPVRLESLIQKALQKEPERRYANVRALAEDLETVKKELLRGTQDVSAARGRAGDLHARAASAERERRLVTILLSGLTKVDKLYETADAEKVTGILGDCLKGLASIIVKYGGTAEKLSAEHGLMATFGAPVAHEDDPERAVRCSVEMRAYVGRFNSLLAMPLPSELGLRIAVHSGTVVAGADPETGYSVMGEAVNVAAGILDGTNDGEICLSNDTLRRVNRLVDAGETKSARIRGKSVPVEIVQLKGIRQETGTSGAGIGKGALVGRAKEIAQLKQSIDAVLSRKEVRLCLSGEPGVGKTRLSEELVRLAQANSMSTFVGRCSSYETDTPYYLWNTLLKSILRLGPEAGESETRTRLHDLLQILSMESEEAYLATLLSLRYEEILLEVDEQRKRRIFGAIRSFLAALAQRQPSVFVLEDLHWVDRFSQALLDFIFGEPSAAPALFFFVFRPEYRGKTALAGSETIDLDRLSKNEATELIRSHFSVESIPEPLEKLLQRRTEGNPFFVEETVRTLLDRGMIAIKKGKIEILEENLEAGVPETVQGVIMARIDRLEHTIREVLLDASVIGREFSRPVLEYVAARKNEVVPSLRELRSLAFILEKEQAQELEYLFKHYLIQEVAYNTLITDKRKKLHGLIARAVEQLYAERLKDFYELVAFHYEKAEEWNKAAEYLNRAGRKVSEMFSKEESNGFFKRKEQALEKLYESRSESRIGWVALSLVTAVITAPLAIVMIAIPYYLADMYINLPPYIQLSFFGSELLGNIAFVLYLLALCVGYPIGALVFLFFGVFPAFRGRPKLYDLWEDQIRVVFGPKKIFSIPFGDVEEIQFVGRGKEARRGLAERIVDPHSQLPQEEDDFSIFGWIRGVVLPGLPRAAFGFLALSFVFYVLFIGMSGIRGLTYPEFIEYKPGWFFLAGLFGAVAGFYLIPRNLFRRSLRYVTVPPYSFGFSSRHGQVRIKRKSGWNLLRAVFPWLHTPTESLFLALTPSDPREFHQQFEIAFAKWKRKRE